MLDVVIHELGNRQLVLRVRGVHRRSTSFNSLLSLCPRKVLCGPDNYLSLLRLAGANDLTRAIDPYIRAVALLPSFVKEPR